MTPADQYERDGFVVTPPLVDVGGAVEAAESVVRGDYDTGCPPGRREELDGLIKIAQPHLASRTLLALVRDPALGRWLAELVSARWLQAWAVDLFVKPPSAGDCATVGWHQDAAYALYWSGDLLTAWLALTDVTEEAAALRYVPGSHRAGFVDGGDLYDPRLQETRDALRLPDGFAWSEVAVAVPAGAAAVHHGWTLHASGPNRSRTTRYALAVRLCSDRNRVAGSPPPQLAHLADESAAPFVHRATESVA